jgi:hypothetical protein
MGLFDELKQDDQRALVTPGSGAATRLALERELEAWGGRRRLGPGYVYKSGGHFLKAHGSYYQGRELPDEYDHLTGPNRHCFSNALNGVLANPELRYVEGVYSTGGSYFTNHAWAIDRDNQVVELTFPTKDLEDQTDSRGGPILTPEHWGYWGVVLHPRLVEWCFGHVGMPNLERPPGDTSSGIRDYQDAHDFPLLRVPYDPQRTDLDDVPYTVDPEILARAVANGQHQP